MSMPISDSQVNAAAALMEMNGTLDALTGGVQVLLSALPNTVVAGDLTVLFLEKGPLFATTMAVAAVLRLAEK